MRSSIILFFIVFFFSSSLSAQNKNEQLIQHEDELVALYNQLLLCQENHTRDSVNQLFYELLVTSLNIEGSYAYPFDNLPTISKMQSDDDKLRIFTYNIQNNEGQHNFYGIVQLNPKYTKVKSEKAILLYNQKGELSKHDMKSFGPDKWPGAVYYEIVTFKKGRDRYYTLAGWRGVDNGLTQKMIDVIYISGDDVKFGYPLFKVDKKVQRRIVFSYNAKATMHLAYDEKQGQFIFNHLAPSSNLVADQYRFYGPDGSYDALVMDKKNWLYVSNVDAKNQEKASDLFYTPVSKPNID